MWNLCRAPLRRSLLTSQRSFLVQRCTHSASQVEASRPIITGQVDGVDGEPRLFSEFKETISPETLNALTVKPYQFKTMSAVQAQVFSLLPDLAKPYSPTAPNPGPRDLLVRARTGTGKTAAFLIPILEARKRELDIAGTAAVKAAGRVTDAGIYTSGIREYRLEHIGALIISPTRELATQIANEALKLSYHHQGLGVRLLCGGNSKREQVKNWLKGPLDIVVATPGRLLDLARSEPIVAKHLLTTKTFVLDEADTLLEMGFRDDLNAIVNCIPEKPARQTFLFSATVAPAIRQITRAFLDKNHQFIDCVGDDHAATHVSIPQYATTLPSAEHQFPHILKLLVQDQLEHPGSSKIIVFLSTTKMTQLFASFLRNLHSKILPAGRHTEIYEIHSKLTQFSRTAASNKFRAATNPAILVTSDVSARGVDYPKVTRVVQVGIPSSRDQYVHRIGRTGRGTNGLGRGDLVLLPFEVGFLTWQLTDIPLKAYTTTQLAASVAELAAKFDANPKEHRGFENYKHPVQPLVDNIEMEIKDLTRRIDPEAVRITFLAQLGYYLAKAPELRVHKSVVLEGLNAWTVEACGLESPPFVSAAFLEKLGLSDGRTKHWSRRAPATTFNRNERSTPWGGRGSFATRDRVRERTPLEDLDPSEEGLPINEFRSTRYGKVQPWERDDDEGYSSSKKPSYSQARRSTDRAGRYSDDRRSTERPGRHTGSAGRYSSNDRRDSGRRDSGRRDSGYSSGRGGGRGQTDGDSKLRNAFGG
ncbi:DEAD-domain-containing protein [Hymenopellis radicata]|nr:DEAD-domain-containing protein [Hymenopellis radicata]